MSEPTVVLLAWCPTATLYLDALVRAGAAPVLVVTGFGAPAEAPLVQACERAHVPLERCRDANAVAFASRLAQLAPDLVLVAGWPRVLGEALRRVARSGIVNFHPSLLPCYRGRHPLFWAILRGEPEVGITLHHVTAEVDAGPILLQRAVAVPQGATSASLAEVVDRAGAGLVPDLLRSARFGALPPGTVPSDAGSYFPPVRAEHALLDWTCPAHRLERLVRACAGVTHAHSFFRGMKLVALAAHAVVAPRAATPGTVLSVGPDGTLVATGSDDEAAPATALRVTRWLFLEREHSAPSLAALADLAPGARLAANPALSTLPASDHEAGEPETA